MATGPVLPKAQAPISGRDPTTREWYEFFRKLLQFVGENSSVAPDIQSILQRLTALEADQSASAMIQGFGSIVVNGSLAGGVITISLQGEDEGIGPTYYYGTGPDGVKGFYPVADAFDVDGLTKGVDPGTGIVTFGLPDITPTPGGTLLLTTFDGKGRRSQEAAATAADLPFVPAGGLSSTDVQAAIVEAASMGGGSGDCCEILVADGISPPVMLTDEAETDFLYSD